jgi:bifunctional non-homologous end joining protein LigD
MGPTRPSYGYSHKVVVLDSAGQPSFNLLQNVGSSKANLVHYVFDVLVLAGKDVMREPLTVRREMLREQVLPKLKESVRESPQLSERVRIPHGPT